MSNQAEQVQNTDDQNEFIEMGNIQQNLPLLDPLEFVPDVDLSNLDSKYSVQFCGRRTFRISNEEENSALGLGNGFPRIRDDFGAAPWNQEERYQKLKFAEVRLKQSQFDGE